MSELGYFEKKQLLNAAIALTAAGLEVRRVAEILGISEKAIHEHLRAVEKRNATLVGIGPNPMAATAHVVLRGVLRALDTRYKEPEDFGDPSKRADVRKTARLLRRMLAWPTRADPLVEQIASRALVFLRTAVLENSDAHDMVTLITIGDAVAGFVGKNINTLERDGAEHDVFVAAEDVIVRTRPENQDEPALDDRAREILALGDDAS